MNIDLDTLENENLIGKLKLISLLERQSPYRSVRDRVERRFSQALNMLPTEYKEPALAIFGSTFYLPKQMLDDSWKYLWENLRKRSGFGDDIEEFLILELDRDTLRDDFYRANEAVGRLQDNLPVRSSNDIIDLLMSLEAGSTQPERLDALHKISSKSLWLLLIDVSISGSSAAFELGRMQRLQQMIAPKNAGGVIALIQVATEQAILEIDKMEVPFLVGLTVPLSCALNTEGYRLIHASSLVRRMRKLCKWFAETHVMPSKYRIAQLSAERKNPAIAQFGFGGMGWNLILHKNAPNNSLPLLWFRPPGDEYLPPFERIDSRIASSWDGRGNWMDRVGSDRIRAEWLERLENNPDEQRRLQEEASEAPN
jgi:hypothetical protein